MGTYPHTNIHIIFLNVFLKKDTKRKLVVPMGERASCVQSRGVPVRLLVMPLSQYCTSVSVITMPGSFQSWLLIQDTHATLKRSPVKGLELKYFLCVNLFLQGGSIRIPFYKNQRDLQLSSKCSLEYRSLDRNHTDVSKQANCTKLPRHHPCWQVKQSPKDTAKETSFKRFDSAALVEAWLASSSFGGSS